MFFQEEGPGERGVDPLARLVDSFSEEDIIASSQFVLKTKRLLGVEGIGGDNAPLHPR